MGFNGTYLGPTIRARKGDRVQLNVTNTLGEVTTTHWHGMHLPAIMDGGPHQIINPNETWRPHWTITNEAATLWYHPHVMGKTGEQVVASLDYSLSMMTMLIRLAYRKSTAWMIFRLSYKTDDSMRVASLFM